MNGVIKVKINQETCDYLQRLDFEVSAHKDVITRLISQAKNDTDASVLESIPFKMYHKKMEEAMAMYDAAKSELTENIKPEVYKILGDGVAFNWSLPDFRSPYVEVVQNG